MIEVEEELGPNGSESGILKCYIDDRLLFWFKLPDRTARPLEDP